MSDPRAPAHVQPFVGILGVDGAVAFLLEFGGATLYFSQDPGGRSEAEGFLGRAKWSEICAIADRLPTRVPTARRWIAHVLNRRGLSTNRIARKLHVTDVAVRKYLREPSDGSSGGPSRATDARQLNLF